MAVRYGAAADALGLFSKPGAGRASRLSTCGDRSAAATQGSEDERIDICLTACDMRIVGEMRAEKKHNGILDMLATTMTRREKTHAGQVRVSRIPRCQHRGAGMITKQDRMLTMAAAPRAMTRSPGSGLAATHAKD